MKQKRRSRFFTFIFSFLPGAAEMYMGFMKNGLSLMLLFFLSFAPMVFFRGLDFLMVFGVILWFYGFFHARNYASMTDEEFFSMEDSYVWDELGDVKTKAISIPRETLKKWVAIILIVVGVAQIWEYIFDTLVRLVPDSYWDVIYPFIEDIPQVAIAVLFIVVGFRMILGKKKELADSGVVESRLIAELPQKQETDSATKEA